MVPWIFLYNSLYHIASQLFIDVSALIIKEMYTAGYPLCVSNYPRYDIKIQLSKHFQVTTVDKGLSYLLDGKGKYKYKNLIV